MSALRDTGSISISLPGIREVAHPRELMLEAVRETAAGEFEVFGEIGRGSGNIIYLARDSVGGKLVALILTPGAEAKDEFTLDVERQLDSTMPAPESNCPRCKAPLRQWGRYCAHCGADLGGETAVSREWTKEELLGAVRETAKESYEVLGQMPWSGGQGFVYFARERGGGKISALRLRKESDGTYSLGRTAYLGRVAAAVARSSSPPEPAPLQPSPPPQPPTPPRSQLPVPVERSVSRPGLLSDQWWVELFEKTRASDIIRQPLTLAIIVVGVVLLLAIALAKVTAPTRIEQSSRLEEPTQMVEPPAEQQPLAIAEDPPLEADSDPPVVQPVAPVELPDEALLEYSVALASFTSLDEAMALWQTWTYPDVPLYVAPIRVRGQLWYRALAGTLQDRSEAEALMRRLVADGVKESSNSWDLRPTRLAFRFGAYNSEREAEAEIGRLGAVGIAAYRVPTASLGQSGAFYVYAGGYETQAQSSILRDRIQRAGFGAELVDRVGLTSPCCQ